MPGVIVLLPRQRLQQDVFLGGEVVHHLSGAHAGPPGDLRQPDPVDTQLGYQVKRRLQYPVTADLSVRRAARPAAPGRRCADRVGRGPGAPALSLPLAFDLSTLALDFL